LPLGDRPTRRGAHPRHRRHPSPRPHAAVELPLLPRRGAHRTHPPTPQRHFIARGPPPTPLERSSHLSLSRGLGSLRQRPLSPRPRLPAAPHQRHGLHTSAPPRPRGGQLRLDPLVQTQRRQQYRSLPDPSLGKSGFRGRHQSKFFRLHRRRIPLQT
jgi:hypothetical protein